MDTRLLIERTHYYSPADYVVMAVDIGGEPDERKLAEAVKKAAARHELLSSRVYQNEAGESFFSPCNSTDARVSVRHSAGDEAWKAIIHEQERIPFDFENGELIRFFISKYESKTMLVIVSHHMAGDGMSFIYLIRDIMTALGNPDVDFERLPIKLFNKEDFPKEARLNPIIRFMAKQVNQSWNKKKRVFTYDEYLAMYNTYWSKRETAVVNAAISGSDLKRLLDLCRKNNVTVNSAVVTAFLLAVKGERDVGIAVNIRPEGFEGMGNYASGISIKYSADAKRSFWQNAKIVQDMIYRKLNSVSARYFLLQFLDVLEPTLIDAAYFSAFADFDNKYAGKARDMFGYGGRPPKVISITNLTRVNIPDTYGRYCINRIDFVPPLVPNAKRIIGVVTINDTMTVNLQYEKKEATGEWDKVFMEAIGLLMQV